MKITLAQQKKNENDTNSIEKMENRFLATLCTKYFFLITQEGVLGELGLVETWAQAQIFCI